jgi:cyclopropane fatty-acyl-phospholipid synthase-like methyltransferase
MHLMDVSRPVLDLGAGQGRNAIFLARQGYTVHALDPSRVAVDVIRARAEKEGLPIHASMGRFETFDPDVDAYSGVLAIGLIQIFSRESIALLVEKLKAWTSRGDLIFVTGFTTLDPDYARHAKERRSVGRHSFADMHGNIQTYLEPGEILELFRDFEAVHHWEGMGPEHHHGDGAAERHAMVDAVFRR